MQKPLIFSGGEDFRELRERGSCYVDKTDMIAKFAGAASAKVSLITRPRRFGKTLMLSTLRESFRIDASSASLFEGLNISRQKEFCAEHMNAYPTLFLSLSFQNADTFEQALNGIRFKVTQLLDTMPELMESEKISPAQREQIQTLYATISYFDEAEKYYHAFLVGMLTMGDGTVRSNVELGNGRPDIVIEDPLHRRAVIIEVKRSRHYEDLEADARLALAQIRSRCYEKSFDPIIKKFVKYGAAFHKKECLFLTDESSDTEMRAG